MTIKCIVCNRVLDEDEDYIDTEDGPICTLCSDEDTDTPEELSMATEQWSILNDQEEPLDY